MPLRRCELTRSFSFGQSARSVCLRQHSLNCNPQACAIAIKGSNSPYTSSLVPAKSIVLTPRVCWKWLVTAALGAAVTPALSAETKVRFWAGAAANCLAVWRRARVTGLEAIVNVWMGYLEARAIVWRALDFKAGSILTTLRNSSLDHAEIAAPDQPSRVTGQLAAIIWAT
jgi:hypothetical protein